jgi:hypothetical protein
MRLNLPFARHYKLEPGFPLISFQPRFSLSTSATTARRSILLGSTRFEVVVSIFSIHLKYPDHKKLGGAGFIRDGESSFGHNRLGSFLTAD